MKMTSRAEEKNHVTFEVKSWLRFHLEMVEYPELSSPKKWVQKGIDLIKAHTPKVLYYLSRQRTLSRLKDCKIIINIRLKKKKRKRLKLTAPGRRLRRIKLVFKIWVQKEKLKRLILVVLESLVIPFTPFLALLPGPNVFFYIPALLLYYHLTSYLGLRKVDVDDLDIEIRNTHEPVQKSNDKRKPRRRRIFPFALCSKTAIIRTNKKPNDKKSTGYRRQ